MDSGLIQTVLAGIMVLGAALFLGRRAWHTVLKARRASSESASCGADGGCGCAASSGTTEREPLSASRDP
jgi:hypothetical protein